MKFDGITADRKAHGTGSTGKDHPFRNRIARQARLAQQKAEQRRQVTLEELVYTFGIPLGDGFGDPDGLSEIERFEEAHGMEHAGVDRVFSAFTAARHDHNETHEETSYDE